MTIRIGTSERDGTFYSQGRALKTLFERRPALAPVEVMECKAASTENANRLHAGEIEFGFMASNWIGRAKNGETPFERPIDLAMAAPMNAGPLFFIVRAQSPIHSFSDLRGRQGKRALRRRCSALTAGLDTPAAASATNIGSAISLKGFGSLS